MDSSSTAELLEKLQHPPRMSLIGRHFEVEVKASQVFPLLALKWVCYVLDFWVYFLPGKYGIKALCSRKNDFPACRAEDFLIGESGLRYKY